MRRHEVIPVAAGTTQYFNVLHSFHHAMSLVVNPNGGTVTVSTSNSKNADSDPGSATWVPSGAGNITTVTELARFAPCTAFRFVATGANATIEVVL
jgi:hypothetical protein